MYMYMLNKSQQNISILIQEYHECEEFTVIIHYTEEKNCQAVKQIVTVVRQNISLKKCV